MQVEKPTELESILSKLSRKRWFQVFLVLFLILLPFIVTATYNYFTALPSIVRIATGVEGGMYYQLSNDLKTRMEKELGIKVEFVPSRGSLDNVLLLLMELPMVSPRTAPTMLQALERWLSPSLSW